LLEHFFRVLFRELSQLMALGVRHLTVPVDGTLAPELSKPNQGSPTQARPYLLPRTVE
jgi:hypothetical protein